MPGEGRVAGLDRDDIEGIGDDRAGGGAPARFRDVAQRVDAQPLGTRQRGLAVLLRQRIEPCCEARDLLDQVLAEQLRRRVEPREQRRRLAAQPRRVLAFQRGIQQRGRQAVRREVEQGAGVGQGCVSVSPAA